MIDSNNKLKSLSKSLIESARKIMTEKKTDKDLAKLAPPYDKVTHGDVLVGRKVYTHDQVKAHKAKKGIKEDADMVVINAPVLSDINGELAEVLKRDPRDKSVHVQLEGMKYILKKGQYAELDEAVNHEKKIETHRQAHKNLNETHLEEVELEENRTPLEVYHHMHKDYGIPNLRINKNTIQVHPKNVEKTKRILSALKDKTKVEPNDTLAHRPHGIWEEVELEEGLETQTIKHPVGQRPKGIGWTLKQAGEQTGKDHSVWQRKVKKTVANEEVEQIDELSKKTLKSYQKKATTSSEKAWNKADKEEDKAMSTDGTKYPEKQERHMKAAGDAIKTWRKREAGLGLAKQKLAKEEVEELDELSKGTLRKYERATQYGGTHKNVKGNQIARAKLHGSADGYRARVPANEEVELDEAYTIRSKGYNNVEVVHKGKVVGRFNDPHSARMHIAKLNKNASVKEEVEDLDEAIKIGSRVRVHAPGKSYHGIEGRIGEIRHTGQKGVHDYTVDYDHKPSADGPGYKSITLPKKNIRGMNEEVEDLDELYKTTLKSYIKKAGRQAANADDSAEHLRGLADKWKNKMPKNNAIEKAKEHEAKAEKRLKGIRKAVGKLDRGEYEPGNSKLAKEDVELSQEEIENIEAILADLDDESED